MNPRWLIAACCGTLFAQAPADLDIRTATIVSEGTPMTASLYSLKDNAGQKLPCVVMAHGWGGTAAALRPDAIPIARAGYYVAAFDYRGWGKSESRLIRVSGELKEVREVVDPIDFGTDWLNAIHWMAGEPQGNGSIGLWGSSFSGGLVVWAAEHDARIKAIHSQVGSMDGRFVIADDAQRKLTYEESTKRARGELGYPEPGAKVIGNLRGAPIRSKFAWYFPVDEMHLAPQCPMQFVIAEKEELFDNRDHAIKPHDR